MIGYFITGLCYDRQGDMPVQLYRFFTDRGYYLHMKETAERANMKSRIELPFLYFNDTCLDLYYIFQGSGISTLTVRVFTEVYVITIFLSFFI